MEAQGVKANPKKFVFFNLDEVSKNLDKELSTFFNNMNEIILPYSGVTTGLSQRGKTNL